MDIIVSLWCFEQRRGYFGLTCNRYTMRKGRHYRFFKGSV